VVLTKNNKLNSFSRGNTLGANKSKDFGINKVVNKEIFLKIKHQESSKNNDMFNFNSYKKVNNENDLNKKDNGGN